MKALLIRPQISLRCGEERVTKVYASRGRLSIREARWSNQRVMGPTKTVAIRNRIVIITHLSGYSGFPEAYNRVTISELALA
jgi:hypothetical protein